ncbi:otoancorin [Xyrauchen texanus]|uniref:otoancorin n=1 Tax=Xyrauchen texanus TaxID=154827 RepID=UPI00224199A3|nr:otoancorin [Xyrauchen texanus]XP_051999821.1 otoancorin [Xyrauchen texanus]XP_051999822.1 otoancorin [Xyrauchen texanus]XP_051999823.1 otoancorin [Xyrauchen texanus]XP_051999824.1 otoancorin [Xyrauchen texanus]
MLSLYSRILILSLLAQWATAMSQGMMASGNQSTISFPRLPPDFKEMARKLMITCSKRGYQVPVLMDNSLNSSYLMENPISIIPELLSSIPQPFPSHSTLYSNETADEQNPIWNITEKIWNCTNMGHLIELTRDIPGSHSCFMQAFVAPLSWIAIVQNGTDFVKEDLVKLIWAAKPFLVTMPPSNFSLPPISQISHLAEMMKMFSEVFNILSEEQRNAIIGWVRERVAEKEFACLLKPPVSSAEPHKLQNGKPTILPFQKCPPGMPWLKAKVLTMMGPFLSRLPIEDVKNIPKEELCEFFRAPDFSPIFHNISGMHPALGRKLFQRLKQECSSGDNFTQNMDRLGSLACFYDDAQHLNVTLSKKLLYQLDTCDNSEIDKVKRQLVQKILDNNDGSYTQEILQSLGSAVSVLPLSKLYRFTSKDLYTSLPSLSKAKWNPAQAKTLAKKLLGEDKNITGEKLLSLGSMVRGVGSDFLKKVKAEGLLGNQVLEYLSEKMSSLQKKALVEAFRRDVNASELVKGLSDSLLPSLSLSMLEKADLSSVDQLEGRGWTHAQSTFLLKKILGNNISLNELRKLGQAVQGVTCEMIERVNQSNALEMAQILTKSSKWLSRDQMRCAAQKLFASLEEQRPGYFSDIRNSELQAIPAMLLIHLPVEKIQNLSDAVCSAFIEKMNQVNLSCLPNSSPARNALTRRALSCLRANTTDLSASEVLSLGPLVCELSPAWMSSLNPVALNSTLQALASCLHIRQQYREHLFRLLTDTYGDPSYWSEDVMKALGPLLLLNDTAVEKLPSKSWLKSYLSDLIGSLPCQPMVPPPKEFSSWLDLSALQRKLFDLKTANAVQGRRKREVVPTLQPTLPVIEDLGQGNVYWSPTQLYNMSVQTFKDTMPTLGEITNYSAEQLAALKSKVLEAWVSVTMLNESQIVELGCISQSFSPEELRNLSITSLDTLELLTICNFTQAQRAAVWQAFEKGTRISVPGLGDLEMVGLGQFICGLQLTQVDQLNSTQFREAVEVVGRAPCPMNITERLKEKAVAAFGKPETWSEAQVGIMGNIMAGLSTVELGRLNSTVMPFIQWSTIPLIPPDRLAALSLNQLKALGPDNAAMVTEAQRAGLRVDQRAAVDEAVGVKTLRAEVSSGTSTAPLPQKGGAPVQRMAEYVVLMQAIMLMMLGYVR